MAGRMFVLSAVIFSVFFYGKTEANASSFDDKIVIPAEANNKIIGVRIDDLVASFPNLVPGLNNLLANIKKSPELFFFNGPIDTIHTIFLNEIPAINSGRVTLHLTAFVKYKAPTDFFEKITVSYDVNAKKLSEMSSYSEGRIDLKETSFKLSVGLVERKLIIYDSSNNIKMIFPLGVGGFDEGVLNEGKSSLLTPRFKNGYIDRDAIISKREKPRYFAGKPFIRILKGKDLANDTTAIGFHIEINDSFVRGFDSHGCMRLRLADLKAFHDLIMDGDEQQTPISISYRLNDPADHPASKRNKTYKTILNNGTKESPFFPLDRDNLVQLYYRESEAPINDLIDSPADNYEEIFNYDTVSQMREQDERRKNECQAKAMAGKIGFSDRELKKCRDEGKREDSVKDRIYRKFMGIDSAFDKF